MHILPLASIVGQELPAMCMLCPRTIIFWEMAIAYEGSSPGPSSPDQTSVTETFVARMGQAENS